VRRERGQGPRARQIEEERAAQSAHDTQRLLKSGGFALLALCVVLGIYASQELKVSSGASASPVPADLAEIEKSGVAPDPHLLMGKHFALYSASVYEYELERGETESTFVPDGTLINFCLYPVISKDHPYHAELAEWRRRMRAGERADEPEIREIREVSVLVKTERFEIVGQIPDEAVWENSIQGLVINRIRSLQPDERRLIRDSLPGVDLSRVLILEDGRTPTSTGGSMMLFVLAALCGGGGIACFAIGKRLESRGRRGRRGPAPESRPETTRPPARRPRRRR